MTTTTGNAARGARLARGVAPDRVAGAARLRCTSVTEQWATVAVVGPRLARRRSRALAPGSTLDAEAFPFMTWREASVAGIAGARLPRSASPASSPTRSTSPAWHGLALWEAVMAAGEPFGITPYGTEAMHVLRAEKGYPIVGQETDGTVTPQDLGMDWIVSKTKPTSSASARSRAPTPRGPTASSSSGCCRSTRTSCCPRARSSSPTPGATRPGADARPRDVELPQRRARPDVRAGAGARRARADRRDASTRRSRIARSPATVTDPVLFDPEGGAP